MIILSAWEMYPKKFYNISTTMKIRPMKTYISFWGLPIAVDLMRGRD